MRTVFALMIAALALAPFAAEAKVVVTINKSTQRMTVSVDGQTLYNWPVSTGRAGRDTPSGQYRAFRMEKDHYSKEWDDAPMPNSIFFTREGHAIHGTYDTGKVGSPASAGCVRLAPENAETLFALVEEHGVLNATVQVVGDVRVALARRPARAAATEAAGNAEQRRSYGSAVYPEPVRPRYDDEPYGSPYSMRRPQYHYGPPGYYESQPYPRYYRW